MSSSILFPTNEYTTSSKSSQQIQKLMMPQQSTLQILKIILTKGHPLQQPYAYRNFYLYTHQLLDLVCGRLPKQESENQIIIVQSLKKILFHHLSNKQINTIFQSLLQSLKNWNSINNQHLVQAVQYIIQMSEQKSQLIKNLQKIVLQMGKQSQPIVSKVIAGRLIPVISKYYGKTIKSQMVDIIKRIISDSQIQAKKVWINQIFPKLLQNLKIQVIQLHLQQKIYQTIYDQNQQIGLMALQTILRNVNKFSIQQQNSRIIKLFIDSMTSKNEKIVQMITSFMGQIYKNLQNIILKNQQYCLKFWKSLIEVAQYKNQKILNNFIYNLPGILMLSKIYHIVDPVCDIYIQLFYNADSDTLLLISYFHEMVQMFPNKLLLLKQTIYNLLSEIFEQNEPNDESIKIIDCLIINLIQCKDVFMQQYDKQKNKCQDIDQINCLSNIKQNGQNRIQYFQTAFNQYIFKYLNLCLNKKHGNWIKNLYISLNKCHQYFSPTFIQISLLPKLYSAIRTKSAYMNDLIRLIIIFLARESSSNILINNYVSKINIQLSKSTRSHERQSAMLFFYYFSFYFSIQMFQQYKIGQKYLQFNIQKNYKNKIYFIEFLSRFIYFFTKQQKIQFTIIINKLKKDNDQDIINKLQKTNLVQDQLIKNQIILKSKEMKQRQKNRQVVIKKNISYGKKQANKEIKKQQILKKRVQTRSRTKMLIKQIPKKKIQTSMTRPVFRKNS